MAALAYTKVPTYHGWAKRIDIRYHYIWDVIAEGDVVFKHIYYLIVADVLSKAIVEYAFTVL